MAVYCKRFLSTIVAILAWLPTTASAQPVAPAPKAFGPSEAEIRREVVRQFARGDFRVTADCQKPAPNATNVVCTYRAATVMLTIVSRLPNGRPHEASVWCPSGRQGPEAIVAGANCLAAISVLANAAKTGWTSAQVNKMRSTALEMLDIVSDLRFTHEGRRFVAQNIGGGGLAFHFSSVAE